jgi:hypothetical protein
MSTFTTPCRVELIGKYRFKLIEPFEYHIGEYPTKDPKKIIRVPVGYITDFASIPRPFWPIVSPVDEYAKAAVIHDWLHVKGYFTRAETDDIFNDAMKVLDVPKWKRRLVYNSVKYFSGAAWRRNRRWYGSSEIS